MAERHDIELALDARNFTTAIESAQTALESLDRVANGIAGKLQTAFDGINLQNITQKVDTSATVQSIDKVTQSVQGEEKALLDAIKQMGEATKATQATATGNEAIATAANKATVGMEAARAAIKNTTIGLEQFIAAAKGAGININEIAENDAKRLAKSLEQVNKRIESSRITSASVGGAGLDIAGQTGELDGLAKHIAKVKEEIAAIGSKIGQVTDEIVVKLAKSRQAEEWTRIKDAVDAYRRSLVATVEVQKSYDKPIGKDKTQELNSLAKAATIIESNFTEASDAAKKLGVDVSDLTKSLAEFINTAQTKTNTKALNDQVKNLAEKGGVVPSTKDTFTGRTEEAKLTKQELEKQAQAQKIINQLTNEQKAQLQALNVSEKQLTAELLKRQAAQERTAKNEKINQVLDGITGVGEAAKKSAGFLDFMFRGLEIGVAHAVGAISVGANVLRSLTHEIIRNLSISVFNFGLKKAKETFKDTTASIATDGKKIISTVASVSKAGEQLNLFGNAENVPKLAEQVSTTLSNLSGDVNDFGNNFTAVFKSIDFSNLGIGIGLILIGKLLDGLGDKLIELSKDLAKTAGDFELSFEKLSSVINALTVSTGDSFGTIEKWRSSIQSLSLQSGKSQKDLTDLALSFTQVGAEAGLSGTEIRELLRVASFTGNQFRNQAEQLANFRRALGGELRFLQSNLGTPADFNSANIKLIETFQKQGLSADDATKKLESMNVAQRALAVIQIAAEPIIKTNIELTGNYSRELEKLQTSIENLKIQLGEGGLQTIFAKLTKTLRESIDAVNGLPKGFLNVIGTFTGIAGIVVEVAAKLAKFAGAALIVAAAWASLNRVLNIGLLAGGGSIFGAFSGFVTTLTKTETSVNSLGGAFKVLFKLLGDFRKQFLSLGGIGSTIAKLIAPLFTIEGALALITFAAKTATKAFFAFAAVFRFAFAIAVLSELVDVLKKVDQETGIISDSIATMRDVMKDSVGAVAELIKEFQLLYKAGVLVSGIAELIGQAFRGVAYGKIQIQTQNATEAANRATRQAEQARAQNRFEDAKKFEDEAKKQKQLLVELSARFDAVEKNVSKANAKILDLGESLFATSEEIEKAKRETQDFADTLQKFSDETRNLPKLFTQDQLDSLANVLKGLRTEIDNLRVKETGIRFGEEAKAAAEQVLTLKRELQNLFEIQKKKPSSGGNPFTEEDIAKAKTVNDLMALLQRAINFGSKEAAKLKEALDTKATLEANLPKLQRQLDLFKEMLSTINQIDKSNRKEINDKTDGIRVQKEYNDEIAKTEESFDNLLKRAQTNLAVDQLRLKVQQQILDLQDELDNGKLVATSEGSLVRVKLDEKQRKVIEQKIEELTGNRQLLIKLGIEEISVKRTQEILADIGKQINGITLFFRDNERAIQDENSLLIKYIGNLRQGTQFAQRQNDINAKTLQIDQKIRENKDALRLIQEQIDDSTGIRQEEDKKLLATKAEELRNKIREAEFAKIVTQELNKQNQVLEIQKKLTEDIVKANEAFRDAILEIDDRAQLFKEGVFRGDFSKVTEQISVFSTKLSELLKIRRDILRDKEQEILGTGVTVPKIEEVTASIEGLKQALQALQFIKQIEDALNAVADAFEQVITDGVRGVLEGTQKISDLFKKMAQNILLSLSSIFAKNAIDGIKAQFGELVDTIRKSDLAKKIAAAFGIDLEAINKELDKAKAQTPQEKNTVAIDANTQATLDNTAAYAAALRGGTTLPTIPPSPLDGLFKPDGSILGTPAATLSNNAGSDFGGPDTFDQFTQDFVKGFEDTINNSLPQIDSFVDTIGDTLSQGFEGISNTALQSANGFFDILSGALTEGFGSGSGSGGLLAGLFGGGSSGGGGFLSSILGLFSMGGAKGGLISGTPSKKDDQIKPVASGEFITQSDAVNYYGKEGKKLLDSFNNMSLPKDFLSNLESNSASSNLMNIKPTQMAPQVITQQNNDRPINITIIDKSPKLDPAAFKMKPEEVTQIVVDGIRKDRIVRRTIREDFSNGSPR